MEPTHEAEGQLTQERLLLSSVESKLSKALQSKLSSRAETTLALRAVQLASMWLGKAKGALGIKTPYPASTDASSKVIEDRADFQEAAIEKGIDEVAFIKGLRADLNQIEKAILNDQLILTDHRTYQQAVQTAYINCCQATMWLGMVLNAIHNEAPVKAEKAPKKTTSEKVVKVVKDIADKVAPAKGGKKDAGSAKN